MILWQSGFLPEEIESAISRNEGMEECMYGGMKVWRNEGMEECMYVGMKVWRNVCM